MNLLYTKHSVIGRLFQYFSAYFGSVTRPTRILLTWLLIGMLALEGMPSIRWLYRHFLSQVYPKSLNCYYRACAVAKLDDNTFLTTTARLALELIPDKLKNEPVFLSTDDTIIVKSGKHFEQVSILHDHALHTGKPYVNGHAFVSLTLCVPVMKNHHGKASIAYVAVPLGYRLWTKGANKLKIAADMISIVMPMMEGRQVILSFDSWYAKKTFIQPLQDYGNLVMVCNARYDSALFDLPPASTGKRGRPAKRGRKLTLDDFTLGYEYDGFKIGHRRVLTNIFGDMTVHAYVTESASGSRRLFFCTADPAAIHMSCAWQEKASLKDIGSKDMEYLPMRLYDMRWNIEVGYYEQKTFWDLSRYMIRSKTGIERMLNLVNTAHSAMKILPYHYDCWKDFQNKSPQELRFAMSEQIRRQVFLTTLSANAETTGKSRGFVDTLIQLVDEIWQAA